MDSPYNKPQPGDTVRLKIDGELRTVITMEKWEELRGEDPRNFMSYPLDEVVFCVIQEGNIPVCGHHSSYEVVNCYPPPISLHTIPDLYSELVLEDEV